MIAIPVMLLGITPFLLLLACGVYFSKGRVPLNFVDQSQVLDKVKFNKSAGRRLLLLPAGTVGLGLIGIAHPTFAPVLLVGFLLVALFTAGWILVGVPQVTNPSSISQAKSTREDLAK